MLLYRLFKHWFEMFKGPLEMSLRPLYVFIHLRIRLFTERVVCVAIREDLIIWHNVYLVSQENSLEPQWE